QTIERDRLCEVILRPQETARPGVWKDAGEYDRRDRRIHHVPELELTEPPPIHDGHHQVEQDQGDIRGVILKIRQSLSSMSCLVDSVPVPSKESCERRPYLFDVVDQQNPPDFRRIAEFARRT